MVLPVGTVFAYNCPMPDDTTGLGFTDWPTCTADEGRCTGRRIDGFKRCLAHLTGDDLDTALARYTPGADVDLRGTTMAPGLLRRLLACMSDSGDPDQLSPRLGQVDFRHCHFSTQPSAHTVDAASGKRASQSFHFVGATFTGDARFDGATFTREAGFDGATFTGEAGFAGVTFTRNAWFDGATFTGDARFTGATFTRRALLGPLSADRLVLDRASFAQRSIIEAETGAFSADDTRFDGGAELRLRYARVSLQRTFFGGPSSLSGAPPPVTAEQRAGAATPEQISTWVTTRGGGNLALVSASPPLELENWVPQLLSVQETDLAQLTLADVDLRWCRFTGAHQLDKLRLEGRGPFNRPPWWQTGWAWPPVWRWTARRVLAEEHPWRARRTKSAGWATALPDLHGSVQAPPVSPERLAVLYRSLRKALEDGKNEPGAGDFYYGEMEARRHAPSTSRAERALLTVYWLVSGYGQRASRALAVLAATVTALFVLLTVYGLPQESAVQQMTGTIPAAVAGQAQQVSLEVRTAPTTLPPPGQRWTAERANRALRIALGSVVFRDTDQRLTPAGVWTVMAGRALGPLLLALAALAIRARVKR